MHRPASDIRRLFTVLILGIAAADGGCYGTPRSDLPDSGQDTSGTVTMDGGAALSITSPQSPTYTNGNVTIEVAVGVASAKAVQILKNGSVLKELSGAPYAFTWDTSKDEEGTYQIVAQTVVDAEIVMSAPITIIVDRTPPTIFSSDPAPGATNVSLTDPIRVVFSEVLAPLSVTSSAVRLAFGTAAVNSDAALAVDGKTIDVAIADRSSISLPGAMTETVAPTITDRAGNPFGGATWSASVPVWVDMGTIEGGYPQMVLGAAGEPIVVTGSGMLRIAQYLGGTSWDTTVPSPQSAGTSQSANTFGIAAAQNGDLFITWIDSAAVQVARWTGSAWDRRWTSPWAGRAVNPSVAIKADNAPVVHWQDDPQGNSYLYQSHVSAWNGTGWTSFPGLPMGPCNSVPCQMVLDKSAFPAVEVNSGLLRWAGSAWIGPSGSSLAALSLNASDQVLSVQDTVTALQVVAFSSQGALTNYVPLLAEAASQINPDHTPQLAVDDLNQPIVVWHNDLNLHVARWTGAAWDQTYGVFSALRGKAAIVVARGSVLILARQDNVSAGLVTRVTKSNH
jgi:hypothetical protein